MDGDNPGWAAWRRNFNDALTSYYETLIWTSRCNGTVKGGHEESCLGEDCDSALDDLGCTPDDFVPGAAREAEEDLYGFVTSCLAERPDAFEGMTADMVGYDFCLTRQGQGVGFWDRGLGERGDWLTAMSKPFGDTGAYLGDDGKLYAHG